MPCTHCLPGLVTGLWSMCRRPTAGCQPAPSALAAVHGLQQMRVSMLVINCSSVFHTSLKAWITFGWLRMNQAASVYPPPCVGRHPQYAGPGQAAVFQVLTSSLLMPLSRLSSQSKYRSFALSTSCCGITPLRTTKPSSSRCLCQFSTSDGSNEADRVPCLNYSSISSKFSSLCLPQIFPILF